MIHFEITTKIAQEQHRDRMAAAAQHRLVAACGPQLTVSRRAARPIGRALVHLGATLLRYGRAEEPTATRPYQPRSRASWPLSN